MLSPQKIQKEIIGVWKHFKEIGVAEDLLIVEAVASLLTKELKFPNEQLRPQLPRESETASFAHILTTLEALALQIEGGKAALFDPYILFQLKKDVGKGQFPIPRHILQLMLAIAKAKPDENIADLTCGSGGFFVYLNQMQTQTGKMVAIEQDVNWARIAQANLLLHGLSINVEQGDALRVAGIQEPLAQERFDCILMAPSFGETIDSTLIHKIFNRNLSTRSDIILPLFALNKLTSNGKSVIVVSTDLLVRGDSDALQLRKELISEYTLEAVVSLPLNALQPFSSLSTNLLVISKNKPTRTTHTWLIDIKNDDFLQGKGLNLIQLPPVQNKIMQFVTKLIGSDTPPFENIYTSTGTLCLQVAKLVQDSDSLGVIIRSIERLQIESVNYHHVEKEDQAYCFLLIKISDATGTKTYHNTIHLSLDRKSAT